MRRRKARHERPARIALVGQFGIQNFGNEASLDMALALLQRDPAALQVVVAEEPDVVAKERNVAVEYLTDPAAPRGGVAGLVGKLRDLRWAWRIVGSVDGVVIPGTGILEGQSVHTGAIPLTLFWYALAARARMTPFLLLSVGVDGRGPAPARWLFRWTLRLATYVSVRDDGSARAAVSLGARRPEVIPDLVLGSEPAGAFDQAFRPAPERPMVALGVIDVNGIGTVAATWSRADYVTRIVQLVAGIVADGADVRVVGGASLDDQMADLVVRESADPVHVVRGAARDLRSLDSQLAGCSVVVAARYHNLVAALRAGTPVVSLGYGAKQEWLLQQFGMGDSAYEVDTFDPDIVAAAVGVLLRSPEGHRSALEARLALAREALRRQERHARDLLGMSAEPLVPAAQESRAVARP